MLKNIFKRLSILFLMVFAVSLVSCVEETPQPETPEVTYKLNETSLTLEVDQTATLSVIATPEAEISVVFSSSNESVATVSTDGTVTGISAGQAVITAKVGEEELTCNVTVNSKPITYTYQLNKTSITVEVDKTQKLLVLVDPEKEISPAFSSSNETVATVSQDGTVKGISEGTATITVTVDGQTLTCAVKVDPKPIEYVYEISQEELTLEVGQNEVLSIVVTPTPETAVVPTWSSSDTSVAEVSAAGVVTALSKGTATIIATLNGKTYECQVTVTSDVVVNSTTVVDATDMSINLTDSSETLDTLYWEHYQGQGTDQMLNAEDLILSNSILDVNASDFWDYKGKLGWTNGNPTAAWDVNTNGKCIGAVIEMEIKVTPNVKQIVVYTGAWRATGTATLIVNDVVAATSDSFTAGDSGIARIVTFDITVEEETTVKVRITPSEVGESGNVSNVAVAILGQKAAASTTTLTMSKTEMTGHDTWNINLTERGTLDWYYVNANNPVEMENGNLIDGSPVNGGDFWDYKAGFTWSNGTALPDTSDNNGGNGKCGGCVRIDVNVNTSVKHVYLYVGGYQSNYYVEVVDSNGNIVHHEYLHDATNGTVAYELDFVVSAQQDDKLSFIVYRVGGANCSITAVAVSDKDIEYSYSLSHTELKMNIGDVQKVEASANPYKVLSATYASTNEEVVKVAADGTITAVGLGQAVIEVTVDGVTLECAINVVEIDYNYTINKSELTLGIGSYDVLSVTAEPVKDDLYVVWESSDNNVATVDSNGKVLAVGAGTATITGTIGAKSVECTVVVTSPVAIKEVTTENIDGIYFDLTDGSDDYDTLYWEHYQGQGTDKMINAEDIILSNNIENSERTFGDYKAILGWTNGTNITAWDRNTNGKHTYDAVPVVEMQIKVNSSVKQIKVFVGAWQATGLVTLSVNGVVVASSEEFTAGGSGIARLVVFDIDVKEDTVVTIKVDPIVLTGGNVSNQAVVILGENAHEANTTVSMSKLEMVGDQGSKVYTHTNLTQRGTLDWYYANYDRVEDQKANADYILTDTLKFEGGNYAWDYTSVFTWTDGTTYPTNPFDDDNGNQGTNNIRYGAYQNVNIKVNQNTKYVYFYVGGYESTYAATVIDSKGTVIFSEVIDTKTSRYELTFEVDAKEEEILTFVIYKVSGANCSLAAIAVADVDNTYSLSNSSVELNVDDEYKLSVLANPSRNVTATFESSDSNIVTVAADGTLKAVASGTAQITVLVGSVELVCNVEVKVEEIQYTYSLSETSVTLEKDQTKSLTVSVEPAKDLEITWESSDSNVVTVENGTVTAVANGNATITAVVDGVELVCEVEVVSSVVATANVVNVEGTTVNLTGMENLIYWEHYQEKYFGNLGTSYKKGVEDLIVSNTIENGERGFGDYKATFNWTDGGNLAAWLNDTRGLCTDADVVAKINVNEKVNKIVVYTGAWRATGTVVLSYNGVEIARSESFTAGESGIARAVEFDLTVRTSLQLEVRIIASEIGNAGNISNPAILVFGEVEAKAATTSVTMTSKLLVPGDVINLTEKGTTDWYYFNYENQSDEMKDGSAIHTVSPGNGFWDYKANFIWSNGTVNETGQDDNDNGDAYGSNNGRASDFFMSIDANVDENTNNVYLYVNAWDAEYNVQVMDQNGNIIFNQMVSEKVNGTNVPYELTFAVNATQADTLSFVVYKVQGSNCGMCAIAVA